MAKPNSTMRYIGGNNVTEDVLVASNDGSGGVATPFPGRGAILVGNGLDDILKGSNFDDILIGGQGSDLLTGGKGADRFQWSGQLQINGEPASIGSTATGIETDTVTDLRFNQGDTLRFVGFIETAANGTLSSYADVVSLVNNSGWDASIQGSNLVLTYDISSGIEQNIVIVGGADGYASAGGLLLA